MLLNEAYEIPAGQGVSTLDDIKLVGLEADPAENLAADNEGSEAQVKAAENLAANEESSMAQESHNQPSWRAWLIVAGVAVLVIAVISSLLLLRRPSGRGRHAAH